MSVDKLKPPSFLTSNSDKPDYADVKIHPFDRPSVREYLDHLTEGLNTLMNHHEAEMKSLYLTYEDLATSVRSLSDVLEKDPNWEHAWERLASCLTAISCLIRLGSGAMDVASRELGHWYVGTIRDWKGVKVKKLMVEGVESDIDENDEGNDNDHEMCEDYEEGVNEEDGNAQDAKTTEKDFEKMFRDTELDE
jgi:hypothetical protein